MSDGGCLIEMRMSQIRQFYTAMNIEEKTQWKAVLSDLMARALEKFREETDDEMQIFAVDCHPWHGAVVLAFLTHTEFKEDPAMASLGEMATWKYYDFASGLSAWKAAAEIGAIMRKEYENTQAKKGEVSIEFLQMCAQAIHSHRVNEALRRFEVAENFKITVPHPDTDDEYYYGAN